MKKTAQPRQIHICHPEPGRRIWSASSSLHGTIHHVPEPETHCHGWILSESCARSYASSFALATPVSVLHTIRF